MITFTKLRLTQSLLSEGGAFIDQITHLALGPPAVIGLVKSRPQIVKDAVT